MNEESTRYYSSKQENYVAKLLNGQVSANSGGGKWTKGDVCVPTAGLTVECKTCVKEKKSFTINKEWFEKHRQEGFAMNLSNQVVCFNFGPDSENYFVIDEKLMRYLTYCLENEMEG